MDSLRYWGPRCVTVQFDLASTRELFEVNKSALRHHQDPILNRVKLIAEPWDVGPGGYQ